MILDLKALFSGRVNSLDIAYSIDMSDTSYGGIYPLERPVDIKGRVFNRADVVNLELTASYEFSAPCDRCGVQTVTMHSVEINRMLALSSQGEQNDAIITVPDMKLDVDELVFSEVFLSLPTKHLCSETCKGICPMCGKCLNEGSCECKTDEIDPRLSKLKELLENG